MIVDTLKKRADRLDKIRSDASLLQAAKIHYSTHPADFICDWGMTYDPRRQDAAIIPFLLFDKQREYIDWLYARYKDRQDGLVEKSRDMGATWLSVGFACWMWIFLDGQSIGFGSRKEDLVDKIGNADSILEKARIFLRYIPRDFMPAAYDDSKHAAFMRITNPANGSVIKGESGDNIGRGGRSSIYFKDESAFYERPDKIDAALSQNSDCKIDISTPNGTGNPFYRKRMDKRMPVFIFDWRDDPRKGQDWYDKQVLDLDPVVLAQEVDRSYTASVANALIPGDLVERAMSTRIADVEPYGELVFGVDVARFGDDRTCVVARRGRAVLWSESWGKQDTMHTVGAVRNLISRNRPKAVFIDAIGVGAGVYDALRAQCGSIIVPVTSSNSASNAKAYRNLRAEMWGNMRDWLKDGTCSIPNDSALKTDLTSLQYKYNADGQMILEGKADAKNRGVKSPDSADALALTFAYPIAAIDDDDDWDDKPRRDDHRSMVSGY